MTESFQRVNTIFKNSFYLFNEELNYVLKLFLKDEHLKLFDRTILQYITKYFFKEILFINFCVRHV